MASKKHKETIKFIYDKCAEISPMCCVHPPSGDSSMCAGGNCACTDDYVCEKCTMYEADGC
jgi:hypothetical protein